MMKHLPIICPACGGKLKVKELICQCETEIEGEFELPLLASFKADDQKFILDFLKVSGSLKDMAKRMRLSYPRVRNRLDEIIEKVKAEEKSVKRKKRKSKD